MRAAIAAFAAQGIDGVSLVAITEAAGASNASAIQYHFGGKDGLIEAILDDYEQVTDGRRLELAAELSERGRPSLRDEISTLVLPWAELLEHRDGVAYLKLLGQLVGHPRFSIVERHRKALTKASGGLLAGLRRAEERDPQRWTSRWILVTGLLFHGFADYAAMTSTRRRNTNQPTLDAFVQELIDAITAVIARR
ncbi:MAG: TetR/AcrR family transcriptional regulator [bacterium]|nr:TetR/AcrR family transcriptional regulator [bacterium]